MTFSIQIMSKRIQNLKISGNLKNKYMSKYEEIFLVSMMEINKPYLET
jgi:hypothetical protein